MQIPRRLGEIAGRDQQIIKDAFLPINACKSLCVQQTFNTRKTQAYCLLYNVALQMYVPIFRIAIDAHVAAYNFFESHSSSRRVVASRQPHNLQSLTGRDLDAETCLHLPLANIFYGRKHEAQRRPMCLVAAERLGKLTSQPEGLAFSE